MPKRIIPKAMFEPLEDVEASALLENEMLMLLVKKETPLAIREAVDNKKTFATIFEISGTGFYLDLPKPYWIPAIEQCILLMLEEEKFEECVVLKELIEDIKKSLKPISTKKPKKKKDGAGVNGDSSSDQ